MEVAGTPPGLGGCQLGGTISRAAKTAADVGRRELE